MKRTSVALGVRKINYDERLCRFSYSIALTRDAGDPSFKR